MSLDLFVAVGGSTAYRSANADTWTGSAMVSGTDGSDTRYQGVAWSEELGLFAAVADSGVIATSPDGSVWTRQVDAIDTYNSIAWSPELGLFVAVGYSSTYGYGYSAESSDGNNWTRRLVSTSEDNAFNSVTWSPELGLFVAVGHGHTATSSNGANWVLRTGVAFQHSVTWSPERSLFVSVGSANYSATSPDGITWTQRTTPTDCEDVTWSADLGLFVAVGYGDGAGSACYSTDGVAWAATTIPKGSFFNSDQFRAVAWAPLLGLLVAVGNGACATSPDGATWTSNDQITYAMNAVTWSGTNVPPNAPSLGYPSGGEVIDRALTNRFSWTPSDPDPGDSQSAYELQYRLKGAASWTATGQVASVNAFRDIVGGTLAAGDYEWRVRTWDAQGDPGPFSSPGFFTAADQPATPTITAPTNGATIPLPGQTVQWSAPNQDAYQLRRVGDNAGAPDAAVIYEDTGQVNSSTTRSRSVTFSVNNRAEHVQVRVKNDGLWSEWATVRVTVSYTQPAGAVVTLTAEDDTGSLLVSITNPAPVGDQPTVGYHEVWLDDGDGKGLTRRVTEHPAGQAWRYWTPVAGRDYLGAVVVKTYGSNGTVTTTAAY